MRREPHFMMDLPSGAPADDSVLDSRDTVLRARWILRALLLAGGVRGLQAALDVEREPVLAAVGLKRLDVDKLSRTELAKRLRTRLEALENRPPIRRRGALFKNLTAVAGQLALSAPEMEILLFVVCLHGDDVLECAMDYLGSLSSNTVVAVLARILELPVKAVAEGLGPDGILATAGLVRIDHADNYSMKSKLDVLQGLPNLLRCEHVSPKQVFARYLRPAPPARLKARDFDHVAADYRLLSRLLKGVVAERTPGVNVLCYGPPGTGKTELVRALARTCRLALYEVSVEDPDGAALDGDQRVSAYRLAQQLLRQRANCLILFDEVEDVFSSGEFSLLSALRGDGSHRKGWMNQLLENNPVPGLWLCNSIQQIDPAFLRRFDFVLALGPPPQAVRRRMLTDYLEGIPVGEGWLTRLAEHGHLTPAHIERAARVARLAGVGQTGDNEACLERVLGNSLQVMGLPAIPTASLERVDYDLSLVNTSADLAQLVQGLARCGEGRICLYGPPGTGKSAFAAHLARHLERPLVSALASDLLNRYVGGTEANIAALFQRANQESAVLLLDEADSLLRDRQGANHSWEVTQVNELLVQIENFRGVLVCATNLMDSLDGAVLRRFDLKVKLDYLRPEHAERLFRRTLQAARTLPAAEANLAAVLRGLRTLDNLTPGDFATVNRKARLMDLPVTPEALLAALTEESLAKPGARKQPIGFNP